MTPSPEPNPGRARWRLELFFLGGAFLFAYHYASLRFSLNTWPGYASPHDLMHGLAKTPFQYRLLVPTIVRVIYEGVWRMGLLLDLGALYRSVELYATLGAVYALRYYLGLVAGSRERGALFALLMAPTLVFSYALPRWQTLYFPWDTTGVALFSLGLALLYQRRWRWFYPLFIIATFNRETTCFLTVIYALTAWRREPTRVIVAHVAAQLALWLAIKGGLYLAFAESAGAGWYELRHQDQRGSHLASNLEFFSSWRVWPFFLGSYALLWWPLLWWREHLRVDPFVQRSLWVFVPFILGMLIVSNIYEVRIFGELLPVIAAAAMLVILGEARAHTSKFVAASTSEETTPLSSPEILDPEP